MAEQPIKFDIDRVNAMTKKQQDLAKQTMKKDMTSVIKYKDYAPSDISPHGDLGVLDDKEQRAFFPKPIKGANAEWRSSKHLPMGKVRTAADYDVMKPRMDACSPVYPEYDKGVYSGVKAGSMVGGHGKNARGTAATVSQPAAVKQKGNSKSPIVNKRVKNV